LQLHFIFRHDTHIAQEQGSLSWYLVVSS